jgi:HlyD family secretion protein
MGRKLKIRKLKIFTVLILVFSLVLQGCSTKINKNNSKADSLEIRGTVEAKEVDINTKIPGRLAKILVEEGQKVKAGQVLAVIESDELVAKKAQAKALADAAKGQVDMAYAALKAAEATLEKAKNGARRQEIQEAQDYYDLTVKTYERVKDLYEHGAVPAQKLDEALTQMNIAKQKLDMAKEGARKEDIEAAQAVVEQARAAYEAAKDKYQQAIAGVQEVDSYLKDTKVLSPINGTVTEIYCDEGELVSTGMPIATVTNLDDVWVRVNVSEKDLSKVKVGQEVVVRVIAYPEKSFKGRVKRISENPDFAVKRATNDNGSQDIMTFEVKVELLEGRELMRPGMTAFVRF